MTHPTIIRVTLANSPAFPGLTRWYFSGSRGCGACACPDAPIRSFAERHSWDRRAGKMPAAQGEKSWNIVWSALPSPDSAVPESARWADHNCAQSRSVGVSKHAPPCRARWKLLLLRKRRCPALCAEEGYPHNGARSIHELSTGGDDAWQIEGKAHPNHATAIRHWPRSTMPLTASELCG